MSTVFRTIQLQEDGEKSADPFPVVRMQVALVRTLIDELERVVPHAHAVSATRAQLADELTRLANRILETAEDLAASDDTPVPNPSHSGVHSIAAAWTRRAG